MKFLIDADTPRSLVEIFKSKGYYATHVRDVFGSASDSEIFNYAKNNNLIIVTKDLGFALMFAENKGYGLILNRLPYTFTVDKINKIFKEFLEKSNVGSLVNSITVIELGRIRTRKL